MVINKAIIGGDVIIRSNSCIGNGEDIIVVEEGKEIKVGSKVLTNQKIDEGIKCLRII